MSHNMEGLVTGYTFKDATLQRQNKKLRALDPAVLERLASKSTLLAACREKSILNSSASSSSPRTTKSPQPKTEPAATMSSKASSSAGVKRISTLIEQGSQEKINVQSDRPPVLIGIINVPQIPYLEKTWPKGILFDEDTHKYRLVGLTFRGSATSIIHGPFAHFDEQAVSKSLTLRARPGTRYFGKTQAEILEDWEAARNEGTLLHLFCETHLNGVETTEEEMKELPKEYHYFLDFLKREFPRRGWRIDATELILSDLASETVGMIDAVASYLGEDGKRRWVILDWKRTRTLTFKAYQGKKGKWPCHEIEDCNGGHYSLQLNLYPELLQMKRGIYVEEMFIGRFYPECNGYELHRIPLRRKVVRTLIASRRRNLCRLDHAEWLVTLLCYQGRSQPGAVAGTPATKRQKVGGEGDKKEEAGFFKRLCTLWVRLAYRSCQSFWQAENPETLLRRTHSLLLQLLTAARDAETERAAVAKLRREWVEKLHGFLRQGQTLKEALLWPLAGAEEGGEEVGTVPLPAYFRSLSSPQTLSTKEQGGPEEDKQASKPAAGESDLYSKLVEIKKAAPYLDHVGLCGTHKPSEFEELHFGDSGMKKGDLAWHFCNVQAEKKKMKVQ